MGVVHLLAIEWPRAAAVSSQVECLVSALAPCVRERIARLRRPEDRLRSALGYWLLRRSLGQRRGAAARMETALGAWGRPHLVNHLDLEFSISHAGRWVVCATACTSIGVDVECVRPVDLRVASRFFHPGEAARMRACPSEERERAFFRLWTAKEAWLKATGRGLQGGLESFDLSHAVDGAATLHAPPIDGRPTRIELLSLDDMHPLAVCVEDGQAPVQVERLTLGDVPIFATVLPRD